MQDYFYASHIIIHYRNNITTRQATKLIVHTDNCAGQNENIFIIWFLSWLVIAKIFSGVKFHFRIAGLTRNVCDKAFSSVKRLIRARDIIKPQCRMCIIDESAVSTEFIPSINEKWFQ